MRRAKPGLALLMLGALTGCNIQIPSQLLGQLNPVVVVPPSPAVTTPLVVDEVAQVRQFAIADTDGNQKLDVDEFVSFKGALGLRQEVDAPNSASAIRFNAGAEFMYRDVDGDRYLDLKEFTRQLPIDWNRPKPEVPTPDVGPGDCKQMFVRADLNGDGMVDVEEFERADDARPMMPGVGGLPVVMPPIVLTERFKRLDRNGDGLLDFDEWCQGEPEPGEEDCKQVFVRADVNGDGAVDFEEFARADYMRPMTPGVAMPAVMPPKEVLFERFKSTDRNGDGLLNFEEWCEGGSEPSPGDCKQVFVRADVNGDGFVEFEEFARADYKRPMIPGGVMATVMPSEDELRARFKGLDRNRDGRLDGAEWCLDGSMPNMPPIVIDPVKPPCEGWPFGSQRAVKFEEMYSYYQRREAATDRVGVGLDPSQLKQAVYDRFKRWDQNKDNLVTQEEFCKPLSVAPEPSEGGESTCHELRWPVSASESLGYDAYAKWRFSAVRLVKAPSDAEVAEFLRKYAQEAKALDRDQDGGVSIVEERASCDGSLELQ